VVIGALKWARQDLNQEPTQYEPNSASVGSRTETQGRGVGIGLAGFFERFMTLRSSPYFWVLLPSQVPQKVTIGKKGFGLGSGHREGPRANERN